MPRIDRLTIQGFRSFGPDCQELHLTSPLTVIWGPNSEGKTSLAEAIEFLFTGDIARRVLLASAIDEFENALRNAHLPAGTPAFVEASVTSSDGAPHVIRRTLVDDFTKRKPCTSRLELDGAEATAEDLRAIGVHLSEPPLVAPVLMQHTLGYLFSANPKERSTYFKSVLEVGDLEDLRETLRAMGSGLPAPPSIHRSLVGSCITSLPAIAAELAPLSSGTPSATEIESAVSATAEKLLSAAGKIPGSSLTERLSQLEAMTTTKQAETFPLHGLKRAVQTADWLAPAGSAWAPIAEYKVKLAEVDRETQRMTAFFVQLLKLPALEDCAKSAVDCPVCATPNALTQERIQAIRDQVTATEDFRTAESRARDTLTALASSASALERAATLACPDFFTWPRNRRIQEGFRTDRIAPLVNEGMRPLLQPWFRAAVRLMRARERVRKLARQATAALAIPQRDLTNLAEDTQLRAAFAPLEEAHQELLSAIEAYKNAVAPISQPLKDAVARKSDTTGWADLITLGRARGDLRVELLDHQAYEILMAELEQACKEVEAAKESVLEDKFADLASEVRTWWDLLRPGEAAFFSDMGPRKRAQRTIDFKAGLAPSSDRQNPKVRNAVAVFSQSQLHCLGLATFFARVVTKGAFLVLDDPILAIDDDYSAFFLNSVLSKLLERDAQVIVLTYEQKTFRAIQERYNDGRCLAFRLNMDDPIIGTVIAQASDNLAIMLKAAEPFTRTSDIGVRKEGCGRIRDCGERFCKELLVRKRRETGDTNALITDYSGNKGTLDSLIDETVPYLSGSDEPGKLRMLRQLTNPGNHDDDVASKAILSVCLGNLQVLRKTYLA